MLTPIFPGNAAKPLGPYSPAMDAGDFVFFSGQIATNSSGGFVNDSLEAELNQIFENIDALLLAAGVNKHHVIKSTVFLVDLNDFAAMNTKYAAYFGDHKPARSTIQVAKLPLDAKVEIEVVVKK